MNGLLHRGIAVLALMLVAGSSLAVDTEILIRVLSRDAKFVGSGMGGARVVLRDGQSGELLAEGITTGATGDTAKLMHDDRGRRARLAGEGDAAFRTTLDLDTPRLITAEVSGPGVHQQAGHAASATQWVVPGKHLSAGDGWIIELPGFVVDVLEPPGQSLTPADADSISINAQVIMMCGCPVMPRGLWDADGYEVGMRVSRDGGEVVEIGMAYAGRSSRFTGEIPLDGSGVYDVTVYAYDPRTGNTGVDRTTIIVN